MENINKFMDQKDPTKKLDLSSISLEDQYTKLTSEEKLLIAAKGLEMNRLPATIDQFLEDDFFLGTVTNSGNSVFPYWREKMREIFPNQIFTSTPYLSLGGSIGCGKSSVSRLMVMYMYHRLDCCISVEKSLNLIPGAKLALVVVHASKATAEKDHLSYIKNTIFETPYFQNLYNLKKNQVRLIAAGPRTNSIIGSNVFAVILSEIGHIPPRLGVDRVNEVLTRVESRFKDKRFNYVLAICDSSAKDEDNQAVRAFETGCNPNELFTSYPAIWDVRKNLYAESGDAKFKVYIGDTIREPYIIENEEDILKDNLDTDRVIDVPLSAKPRFVNDIIHSIMELAGKPINMENKFFKNITHLINCSKVRNLAPEEIIVDFYNKQDSIFDQVSTMVYRIPRGTHLCIGIDLGLKTDKTGLTCSYYDKDITIGNLSLPTFKIPLLFTVSRLKGQETSLDHILQFILDLIKNGYYVTVGADSFASAGLFQSLARNNIEYRSISVDKTMDAYNLFKNVVNTERVEIVKNNILLREASEVLITFQGKNGDHMKVDHPEVSKCVQFDYIGKPSGSMPGTKDLLDSTVSSIYLSYQKYAEYKEGGPGAGVMKSMQALEHVTRDPREESAKVFQNMLENIF